MPETPPNIPAAIKGRNPFQLQHIFGPENPAQGENSSSDPAFLTAGVHQRLTNLLYSNRGMKVRNGIKRLTAAVPIGGASFRGSFSGFLDGQIRMYAAYRVAGTTRVYEVSGLTTLAWTFTEITQPAGVPENDESEATANVGSRFYDDGTISFAIVSDGLGPTPTDILVFGNGINAPRVQGFQRKLFAAVQSKASTHGTVTPPSIDLCSNFPDCTAYLDVRTSTATTIASVPGVVLTKEDSFGEKYFKFVVSGTGTGTITMNGVNASWFYNGTTWVNQNAFNFGFGSQMWLVCEDSNSGTIWPYMKITISDGVTPQVVYDASSSNYTAPAFYPLEDGKYIAAFSLVQAQITTSQITSIVIECVSAPAAALTFYIDGILVGGNVPGDASYAISYIHTASRSESGSVVATVKNGPKLGGTTGRGCAATRISQTIPPSNVLLVREQITYPHNNLSPRVDYAMLYRADSGETVATFVQPMLCPRVSSMWGNLSFFSDNAKSQARYINRVAPSGSNVSTPYGGVLLSSSGRLFVGKGAELFISGDRAPFRYSFITTLSGPGSSSGPAYHKFQGETLTFLAKLPGHFYGASPIAAFTDQNIYRLEGLSTLSLSRASLASYTGCPFPKTVGQYKSQLYFVSSDRQITRIGSGEDGMVSLYRVDDRILTIDLSKSSAAATYKGYSLAHISGVDALPKDFLQFDAITGHFGSAYVGIPDVSGMLNFQTGSDTKTIAFSDLGHIYWLFRPGEVDDDGTGITVTIKTPEYHNGQWGQMHWGPVGMVADTIAANPVFTISRFCPRTNVTVASQLKFIGVVGNRLYRWDELADTRQGRPGLIDLSCVITISGVMPGGTNIQSIVMKTREEKSGADLAPSS